jgi:hypothetical protein
VRIKGARVVRRADAYHVSDSAIQPRDEPSLLVAVAVRIVNEANDEEESLYGRGGGIDKDRVEGKGSAGQGVVESGGIVTVGISVVKHASIGNNNEEDGDAVGMQHVETPLAVCVYHVDHVYVVVVARYGFIPRDMSAR